MLSLEYRHYDISKACCKFQDTEGDDWPEGVIVTIFAYRWRISFS